MKPIISNFNKNEKQYTFLKLGFITRLIEEKEIVSSKFTLSESELSLHAEYFKKIENYKKDVDWIIADINGNIKKEISSIFFSNKIFYDSKGFADELSIGRSFFIGGYLGALVYLSSISENKEKKISAINNILKKYNTTPSPIAKKWGFSDIEIGFIINWKSFVDFLINRKITGCDDFLIAVDELLLVQKNVQHIPEYKKIINHLQGKEDSIRYAKRIQESLLPNVEFIKKRLRSYSLCFKPKDILSGDFHLFKEYGDITIIACGDCTGHGVPGALLTVLSINIIDQILDSNKDKLLTPALLMSMLDKVIINSLNRNYNPVKGDVKELIDNLLVPEKYDSKEPVTLVADGLELAVCFINKAKKEIVFCGAGLSLFILNDNNIYEVKQRKNKGIGGFFEFNRTFEETKLSFNNEDVFILSTDGIMDQFGGIDGSKLMKKRFKEITKTISQEPSESALKWSFFLDAWLNGLSFEKIQSDLSNNSFTFGDINTLNYFDQIDDITVISFRV